MKPRRTPESDGTRWLAALLLLAVLVLVALAWQAIDAARGHRQAADEVLSDYASLAADELVRRSFQTLGYAAGVPLLQQLTVFGERGHGAALPTPAALSRTGEPRLRDAASIMATTVRLTTTGGSLELAGRDVAPAVADWLRATLGDPAVYRRRERSIIDTRYAVIQGVERRLFFAPIDEPSGRVYGFLLDEAALGPRLRDSILAAPVLPASLGDGTLTNERLHVRIADATNRPILAGGADPVPDAYAPWARRAFGDDYGGLLDGWTIAVALDPGAASQLVIGGLPRSRLPAIAGLIALGLLLFAGALVQLRRARRLARLRADFVAEVSHELRTPLTQIRMFNEMLLLGRVRSEAEARRALEIVDREARRLGRLVDNILSFAKGERGARALVLESRRLAPLCRSVIEEMAPLAAARGADLEADLDPDLVAHVDDGAWHQMLINLLDNAVKYGPRGQRIGVSLRAAKDKRGTVELAVEDQGPGVPARERSRIFDSYHRLGQGREAAVAGTGIGLAVVHDLACQHGGSVRVETADGGGARFVVSLPPAVGAHPEDR